MDTAQWPQEMVVKPIEEIVGKNSSSCAMAKATSSVVVEKKPRPQKEQALNCPRCHSINTKFCYYNNYSLTQPRYFCKTCRRYWTEGGSLRNIPVGGGSRKNKRSSLSSSNSSNNSNNNNSNSLSLPSKLSNNIPVLTTSTPKLIHQGQDLNLAFPSSTTPDFTSISHLVLQQNNNSVSASSPSTTTTTTTMNSQLSAMELLNSRGLNLNAFNMPLPDPNSVNYTCGLTFPMQDFKPTMNFSLDGIASGYTTSLQGVHETSGRILFPFEDLKQVSSNTTMDQNNDNKEEHHGDSNGYWTGMLGS